MRQRLYRLLNDARPGKVLVVGDIILDRYVEGSVERISQEAPVQVFEAAQERELLGGGANVAANVAALGASVYLVGVVGRDDFARSIRAMLKKRGINAGGLIVDDSRPTTRKTRFLSAGQQMLRVDHEMRHGVSMEIGRKMLDKIEKAVKKCSGVIISDYGKGALPGWLLKKMFAICKKAGRQVIVDPKGVDYSRYLGATMITPNKKEAATATGIEIKNEKDYKKAALRIFKSARVEKLVITRGSEGMSVFDKPDGGVRLPAEALEVFDVSGAGDTVIATLSTTLFSGFSLDDAARVANVAAGIEVGHVGAWPVTKEDILEKLRKEGPGAGKLMSQTQGASYAGQLRASNKKVVFTNGCFDLLHAGHVKLLRKAKALGDCLIVGINTDNSIRRLKGKNRPLLDDNDRIEIMGALDCVDAVIPFDEDTPLKLIKAIKPDVLVKGADYNVKNVVGHDVVKRYGGRVELVPLAVGKSTSGLIKTILKNHGK
ncbi:MAG TPA: D-glycero-beta-D-manno-heptose-7-phosphate kinase [Nitrospirae bacterium]|nr:D-glycero-beta-D-manno-heptose-7-phosphate kinase [Nitrospirota bacterium]